MPMWVEPGDEIPLYGNTSITSSVQSSVYHAEGETITTLTDIIGSYVNKSLFEDKSELAITDSTCASFTEYHRTARCSYTSSTASGSSSSLIEAERASSTLEQQGASAQSFLRSVIVDTVRDVFGITAGTTIFEQGILTFSSRTKIGTAETTTSGINDTTSSTVISGSTASSVTFASWDTDTTTFTGYFTSWVETTLSTTVVSTSSYTEGSQTIFTTAVSTEERPWRFYESLGTTLTSETVTSTSALIPGLGLQSDTVVVAQNCEQLYAAQWCNDTNLTTSFNTTVLSVSTSEYSKWVTTETVSGTQVYTTYTTQDFLRVSSITEETTSSRQDLPQCTDLVLVSEGSLVWESEFEITTTEGSTEFPPTSSSTASTSGGASETQQAYGQQIRLETIQGISQINTCLNTYDIRPCLLTEI